MAETIAQKAFWANCPSLQRRFNDPLKLPWLPPFQLDHNLGLVMKWLTPEEAIATANLTATATKLDAIAKSSNGKNTAEERFHALGLLFDRERYEAGHSDFLKLLHSATDEEEQTEEDELDQEDLEAASNNKESSNSASPTQPQSEPYIFEQCKVQVVITLLPSTEQPGSRPVMLAASSHGDFPIVAMLTQKELGSLPPAIVQLLDDLKADFPNRQVRRNIAQTQTAKATPKQAIQPQVQVSKTSPATSKSTSNSQTQISLF